jgi:hypothetical protein
MREDCATWLRRHYGKCLVDTGTALLVGLPIGHDIVRAATECRFRVLKIDGFTLDDHGFVPSPTFSADFSDLLGDDVLDSCSAAMFVLDDWLEREKDLYVEVTLVPTAPMSDR